MTTAENSPVVRYIRGLGATLAPAEWSDAQLLERFAEQGDEIAFEALVRRHGPLVLGVCRRVLGDWHDAEDAFQATFLVLLQKAASIREHDSAAGTRRTEGAFVLRRAPSAESPAAAPAAEEVKRPWWKRWSSP